MKHGGHEYEAVKRYLELNRKYLSGRRLQSQIHEEIERVVSRMKNPDGVTSVILFGSYSRGDLDEGSDVDHLLTFKDMTKLNKRVG